MSFDFRLNVYVYMWVRWASADDDNSKNTAYIARFVGYRYYQSLIFGSSKPKTVNHNNSNVNKFLRWVYSPQLPKNVWLKNTDQICLWQQFKNAAQFNKILDLDFIDSRFFVGLVKHLLFGLFHVFAFFFLALPLNIFVLLKKEANICDNLRISVAQNP